MDDEGHTFDGTDGTDDEHGCDAVAADGSARETAARRRDAVAAAVEGGTGASGRRASRTATRLDLSTGVPTPRLEVDGSRVVDPTGDPVRLRGVNVADPRRIDESVRARGKTAPQVIDYLTSEATGWCPRAVRIPCQPQDVAGLPSPWDVHHDDGLDPAGFVNFPDHVGYYEPGIFDREQLQRYLERHLDPVVERCRERGVYCIVDFHRHWGDGELRWADPETGEPNRALSEEVELFWETVAPRYADRPHVCYEVYNEPTMPGMWGDPREREWVAETWRWWLETAQPWVDVVREHASNLAIVGSPGWSQSPEGALLEPFDGENLGYAYHVYPHHGASERRDWEDASWRADGEGVARVHEAHPVFVTEWGWFGSDLGDEQRAAGDGDRDGPDGADEGGTGSEGVDPDGTDGDDPGANVVERYGAPFVDWMEDAGVHWTAWCVDPLWSGDVSVRAAFDGECEAPPCAWEVVPGEESLGRFVRALLYELRDDGVPADVEHS